MQLLNVQVELSYNNIDDNNYLILVDIDNKNNTISKWFDLLKIHHKTKKLKHHKQQPVTVDFIIYSKYHQISLKNYKVHTQKYVSMVNH